MIFIYVFADGVVTGFRSPHIEKAQVQQGSSDNVIDRIIELERKDQREISIRPHPHEFYLYFDV